MGPESILYFLAGVGVVFYGIRQFTQSLQGISGPFVRYLINSRTSHLGKAGVLGTLIAVFTQNSLGFSSIALAYVNAGLLNVSQSLALLFGAQIGFTTMAWFLAVSGSGSITFLMLFLGAIPSVFGARFFVSQIAKCFFGIGLILLGIQFADRISLDLISQLSPYASLLPEQAGFLQKYILIFLVSALLTSVSRSKLFVVAILFALLKSYGFSSYFLMAFLSGLGVGGAIPSLLSVKVMNSYGKRSSIGYFGIEMLVAVLVMAFLPSVLPTWNQVVDLAPVMNLAILYSLYTVFVFMVYTLLEKSFLRHILNAFVPEANHKEAKSLKLTGSLSNIPTSLAVDLVEQEIKKMSAMVQIQLDLTRSNLVSRQDDKAVERKISKYEKITDNIELEIDQLIDQIMERSLLEEDIVELRCFSRLSTELENTADVADELIQSARALRVSDEQLSPELVASLRTLGTTLQEYFILVFSAIVDNLGVSDTSDLIEKQINRELKGLRQTQKDLVSQAKINSDTNQILFDIQSCFSRILEYSNNILESVNDRRNYLDKIKI